MSTLAGIFLAAVNLLYAAVFGGPIDGTSWDVKVKKDSLFSWSSQADTVVFSRGRALIAGEVAKGYSPALYNASEEKGGTAFSVRLADAGRDPVEWSGRVSGARINGVVVVRGPGGRVRRYVFSGERKTG